MNRTAIKKFATWARANLREQIAAKAARYGVTARGLETPQRVSGGMTVAGFTHDAPTTALYDQLVRDLNAKRNRGLNDKAAFDALVDEMAYTWFNRFTALRFMEVRGYALHALSSSTEGLVDPDLLQNAGSLVSSGEFGGVTLDDLDRWRRGGDEEVYRNLLVAHCRNLAGPLPFLFGEGKSYAALFLPDNLLTTGSVVRRLVQDIPEEDWQDIEIIGWLYQFYISERKDEVFAAKKAYDARDIPAATQLFTPHWIVRYMVENSLGRLWLEAHPESNLRAQMPYYLESQNESHADGEQRRGNPNLKPEDLSVLDPACGSGHILVYAFDLLFAVYQEQGYPEPQIPALILEHNLRGLDIDERAAQLTSFALMMKARERSRRILHNPPELHITQTVPTRGWALPDVPELNKADWEPLIAAFKDADNLGSLISPPPVDTATLSKQLEAFTVSGRMEVSADLPRLRALLKQTALLSQSYLAVVANPPYMGSGSFNKTVKEFVNSNYSEGKQDLYGVYIIRNLEFCAHNGVIAMITIPNWMFLSSFEGLRQKLLTTSFIESMVHNGRGVWGSDFGSCSFTLHKTPDAKRKGTYKRLFDKHVNVATNEELERRFFERPPHYAASSDFEKIPGSPVAYWVSERVLEAYSHEQFLGDIGEPRQGIATGNNDQFLRHWSEIMWQKFSLSAENSRVGLDSHKWFPCNKGGEARRWYGNNELCLNWENNGVEIRNYRDSAGRLRSRPQNTQYFFRKGATWSTLTSGSFSMRYSSRSHAFETKGSVCFPKREEDLPTILGFCNSTVASFLLGITSPTLDYHEGPVGRLPLIASSSESNTEAVQYAIEVSKTDWDNFETSWDFQTHPLLRTSHPLLRTSHPLLRTAFTVWQNTAAAAFTELKRLEEENNRYWIDAYGLQDELTPDVPDAQITVRRADLLRDVKSLVSYAVGCLMGRYSLSQPGLQFAGGTFERSAFSGDLLPDADGILPITDEAYFEDDIITGFVDFLRAAFGPEQLEENLSFVADALTRRAGESPLARLRRYFVTEFVSDHIQTYKKRPLYWLFTSGKGRAFGALVYLHRYTPDTLSLLRNNYVLPLQSKLAGEIAATERALSAAASASAAKVEEKRLGRLREQVAELLAFHDRLLHKADQRIELDLDDGVAYNYTLFDGLLYTGADLKLVDLLKKSQWKRDLLAATQSDEVVAAD